ncbi:MAG: Ppx/GppA phosphatase family protein [Myxococcaceae bacterium]
MGRYASIDIGTNSVLLLVAEKKAGRFEAVVERAEITRLGRGVDRTKTLESAAIEDTLKVLEGFTAEARKLGAEEIAVSATSAARDASNGKDFLEGAFRRAGVRPEIISGDEEAQLSFTSAWTDFGGKTPMIVVDIGGGSTELIFGDAQGQVTYRHSFDVGSVRLTERFVTAHPISEHELLKVRSHLEETFAPLPQPPAGATFVGVAGTVTTVCSVHRRLDPYDATQVHGATLSLADVSGVAHHMAALGLEERRKVPGLQPKRADVIPVGAAILEAAMRRVGAHDVRVSDRGLRWGLLMARFGSKA